MFGPVACLAIATLAAERRMARYPLMVARDNRLYMQLHPGEYIAVDLQNNRVVWRYKEPAVKIDNDYESRP